MRIVDSHFHWYPRAVLEKLAKRTSGFPRAVLNGDTGDFKIESGLEVPISAASARWYDLDGLFASENSHGYETDVVCSAGPIGAMFSSVQDAKYGLELCQLYNEELAGAQKRFPGRLWASGVVPLQDTALALEELERCIGKLGLMGVNVPGSIGMSGRIDEERLEPFYDRVEQLGIPLFLHPTDLAFRRMLDGYNGALYESLGRVVDVSVAAYRLVLSGIMARHPKLKVVMSHGGGALPYQAGRMDKNSKAAKLPEAPSVYLRRMYTDTVQPHVLGLKFTIDFYGIDHVMYGDDFPCWHPEGALGIMAELDLSQEDREKVMNLNARRILGLKSPESAQDRPAEAATA